MRPIPQKSQLAKWLIRLALATVSKDKQALKREQQWLDAQLKIYGKNVFTYRVGLARILQIQLGAVTTADESGITCDVCCDDNWWYENFGSGWEVIQWWYCGPLGLECPPCA